MSDEYAREQQLQNTEHPADCTEEYDRHERQHLEYDTFEVSDARTDITTFELSGDEKEKWTRLRNMNAGVDGHGDSNEHKVDLRRHDKRIDAQTVCNALDVPTYVQEETIRWIMANDLFGYSRHYGGVHGATAAECMHQIFDTVEEAMQSPYVEMIEEVTSGVKLVDHTNGDVVEHTDEIAVEPVDVEKLLRYHFEKRSDASDD